MNPEPNRDTFQGVLWVSHSWTTTDLYPISVDGTGANLR